LLLFCRCTQFRDVQAVGQPLSQLVIGTSRPPSVPPDQENSYQTEQHRTTQDLVMNGDDTLEGLVRLSGAISMEGADATHSLVGDENQIEEGFGEALQLAPSEISVPPKNVLGAGQTVVLGGQQTIVEATSAPSSFAPNLTTAFAELSTAGLINFTLTWWGSANLGSPPSSEQTREYISFVDPTTGTPRLTVCLC
jgi:hypothetical protein